MNSSTTEYSSADSEPLSESSYRRLREQLTIEAKAAAQRLELDWDLVMQAGPDRHTPARQALVLLELGLFDTAYYLSSYPDIVAAGLDPIAHYVNLGDAEGRKPNPIFDPDFYRTQFDRGEPAVTALYHYAVLGEALGLKASSSFSPRRYLQSNSELQPWLDKPLTHYLHLGSKLGLMVNHRGRLSEAQKVRFERDELPPPPKRVDPAGKGLNVIGPLDRVSGLGVSARGYLDGLRTAGLSRIGCRAQQREFAIQSSIEGSPEFPPYLADGDVNLVHMNGDTLPVMVARGGDELFRSKYNIAVWYWELPTLRPEWQASMKYFHEFWAPTPFIYRMLRQSTGKPVHLLPPYLKYLRGLEQHRAAATDATRFVYCFDANSILERKNPAALLDAFLKAFPRGSTARVELTFKITYPNRKVPEVDYLYRTAENDSRIEIFDRLLGDSELHALISSASAYVSPHRSEGLGLTVIEAMGAGVPVISTAFGGVDAFVDAESAYPVDYRLVELEDDYVPYPRGFVWADPSVDAIAARLIEVHGDPTEANRRAALAQQRVFDYFCAPELIERYQQALERITRL